LRQNSRSFFLSNCWTGLVLIFCPLCSDLCVRLHATRPRTPSASRPPLPNPPLSRLFVHGSMVGQFFSNFFRDHSLSRQGSFLPRLFFFCDFACPRGLFSFFLRFFPNRLSWIVLLKKPSLPKRDMNSTVHPYFLSCDSPLPLSETNNVVP